MKTIYKLYRKPTKTIYKYIKTIFKKLSPREETTPPGKKKHPHITRLSIVCPTYPGAGKVGDLTRPSIEVPTLGPKIKINAPIHPHHFKGDLTRMSNARGQIPHPWDKILTQIPRYAPPHPAPGRWGIQLIGALDE